MSQTDYNQVIAFNVTLPTGEKLTNYDRLFFDRTQLLPIMLKRISMQTMLKFIRMLPDIRLKELPTHG
jgi:hypothetical protein